jgi:hypothetical protein
VADGEVCACSEGGAEVEGVEDGTFLVDEVHLLFEGEGEEEGLAAHVRMQGVGS